MTTGWAFAAVALTTCLAVQSAAAEEAVTASKGYAKQLSAAFRNAAQEVLPAVVSIRRVARPASGTNRGQTTPRENPFEGTPFEDMFEDMFRDRRVPRFEVPNSPRPQFGMGSGIVIDPAGVILTNNHVVEGNGDIRVQLADGRQFDATKVETDTRTDLAVVWIEGASDLKAAQLGDSDQLEIGDWVLAVGHPFGLFKSVTAGIISAKGRGIGVAQREEFLQTDAAINPGNSGGPLVNLDGQVVGINTAISSNNGGYQGAGFAIPVNLAKWVVGQLIETGSVRRAYLGTQIAPVTQELAEEFGVPVGSGALVTEVFKGSPADAAGLKPGDVIVSFAGAEVAAPRDLVAAVETSEIGSRQRLGIMRDGKQTQLEVQVKLQPERYGLSRRERPDVPGSDDRMTYAELGLEIGPVTQADTEKLGLKEMQGVVITKVDRNGPAALAGLAPGMVITQADRKIIGSPEEFDAIVKGQSAEDEGLLLLVRTLRGSQFVVIRFNR